MDDLAAARLNMVESQIRPNKVTDPRILEAMLEIPREIFVPASLRSLAYMDDEVPVEPAGGTTPRRALMSPMAQARLIQLANVHADDLVLDVGCATGYSTAILAKLAGAVIGLEMDEDLAAQAAATLAELEADNADIAVGALRDGAAAEGPYDVILLEGSVPDAPSGLLAQLKEGGRLVAILRGNGLSSAYLYEKVGTDFSRRRAFDAGAPPLPDFDKQPVFVF